MVYWRINDYAGYNHPFTQYNQALENDKRPLWFWMRLPKEEQMAQKAVFGIKTRAGIYKQLFKQRFGEDFDVVYNEQIKLL